jgi:hypothetical protein
MAGGTGIPIVALAGTEPTNPIARAAENQMCFMIICSLRSVSVFCLIAWHSHIMTIPTSMTGLLIMASVRSERRSRRVGTNGCLKPDLG